MRNYLDQIRPDHRVSTVMSPLGTYSKKYHPHPEPDYIYMYTGSVVNNPRSRWSCFRNMSPLIMISDLLYWPLRQSVHTDWWALNRSDTQSD